MRSRPDTTLASSVPVRCSSAVLLYSFCMPLRPLPCSLFVRSLACAALLSGLAASAQSGNPAPMQPLATHDPRVANVMKAMDGSKSPTWVALSPDGATVAWTLRSAPSGIHHSQQRRLAQGLRQRSARMVAGRHGSRLHLFLHSRIRERRPGSNLYLDEIYWRVQATHPPDR
jgi:glucose/arabinose dehydrogenase